VNTLKRFFEYFIIGLTIGLIFGFVWGAVEKVLACERCKHENAECEINNSEMKCCEGLVCVPFNESSGNGKCEYPEATPTPTETPTPTPTDEPKPTPTEEPTPTVKQDRQHGPASAPPLPICDDMGGWAPTITKVWRVDEDTVGFEWTKPRDEADEYILWYGLTSDKLDWNVYVAGQSATIDLPDHPNVHVWAAVQETDKGCLGNLSQPVDP
jgi:hypothetical protein